MWQTILNAALPYLIPIIVAFSITGAITGYQHLLRFLPEKQRDMLEYAVSRAITAVEQTMPMATSLTKKQEAMLKATEILNHFGLNIPAVVIDTAIESSLNALKALNTSSQQSSAIK